MTGKYYEQDALIGYLEELLRRTRKNFPNSPGEYILSNIIRIIVKDVPTVTAADIKHREGERNSKQYGKEIKTVVLDEFKSEDKIT
jgi:hypothetical protein